VEDLEEFLALPAVPCRYCFDLAAPGRDLCARCEVDAERRRTG
jgi:hypothetical protein